MRIYDLCGLILEISHLNEKFDVCLFIYEQIDSLGDLFPLIT